MTIIIMTIKINNNLALLYKLDRAQDGYWLLLDSVAQLDE